MKEEIVKYTTQSGLEVFRKVSYVNGEVVKAKMIDSLNSVKGAYFSSSFEYPGRYTRWDVGFINPPLEIRTFQRSFEIRVLNQRGEVLLETLKKAIQDADFIQSLDVEKGSIKGEIKNSKEVFSEENRSKKPTVFSLLRAIKETFYSKDDDFLGLYGAFGYDLIHQFEEIELKMKRDENHADIVLFIPDELFVKDNKLKQAYTVSYEFEFENYSSKGLEKVPFINKPKKLSLNDERTDFVKGKYAEKVKGAMEYFKRGDMFEVVPSHVIYKECDVPASVVYERLVKINPSPYGFFINLGDEHLIGASPEMYVRVDKKRIETCPISGTIKRGNNAIEDSERINEILNSKKDESELTMCTDVDRNDKSRICVPGSVNVIGRRQIELYSHLIHTVDHVEGTLRDEFDSLDGFMSHMWAVTVTGAPKKAAIKWIEENEDSPREWYGGAVGFLKFNGNINTGLTLRTIKLRGDVASIRVGATVLFDSIPEAEEEETITKAAALVKVLEKDYDAKYMDDGLDNMKKRLSDRVGAGKNVLFVDHEDSFVNTLADYFRKTGATVTTFRFNEAQKILESGEGSYDLVVLSPGPGTPSEFQLNKTIKLCMEKDIPIFGVCLGLQGLTEYFGGRLAQLDKPFHGKQSIMNRTSDESLLFEGLPSSFKIGRYHSLYAVEVPECFDVTGLSDDAVIMAIEHRDHRIAAVQFHPESIMTMENDNGFKIIKNVLTKLLRV